ncbi:putative B6 ABC transporter substrate-binding protein [Dongia rigui]|uniref:BMP family protein n=1 Tax=Dongia rigui TaxID=940149 RepID=A0ABU5DZF2_9PROT|nr:BMP family protein [Dongia rigui]MDY0872623.1 BMP family protein [Dongia rigui]
MTKAGMFARARVGATGFTLVAAAITAIISGTLIAQPAAAREVKKLAILTPEDPTDYGWNQQGYDAAKAVAEKLGLDFMPATGLGYGDVHPTLRELADDGASLLIAHASGYNTAAPEVGAEKNVAVAIVDRPNDSKEGAVADYTLSGHEGAYLAGVLAAKTTQTKAVGIVVSGEPPSWNSQSAAFAQGVKATRADVKILYAVIGPAAYSDAAGGRRVTDSVIGAGADVIFGQGDGASFGMLQAVETAKSTSGGKVWFIDVIGDKTPIDKGHLLSSVVWNLEPVYTAMVEDLKADKFGTHPYSIQLADDSVRLLKTNHIADDVWAAVSEVRQQIVDGKLKIEPVWEADKVRALMSSITDAGAQ